MMDLDTLVEVNELAAKHPGMTVDELLALSAAERLLARSRKLSEVREAVREYRRAVRQAKGRTA